TISSASPLKMRGRVFRIRRSIKFLSVFTERIKRDHESWAELDWGWLFPRNWLKPMAATFGLTVSKVKGRLFSLHFRWQNGSGGKTDETRNCKNIHLSCFNRYEYFIDRQHFEPSARV